MLRMLIFRSSISAQEPTDIEYLRVLWTEAINASA